MRRTEVMTISEFMSRDFVIEDQIARIKRKKNIINVTLKTGICLTFIFMATQGIVGAEGLDMIDTKANDIYVKLLTIGKWFIIVKGALQTINKLLQGEDKTALKTFVSYLVVYVILKGLPWVFDQVDIVFKDL